MGTKIMKNGTIILMFAAIFSVGCAATVVRPQQTEKVDRIVVVPAAEFYDGYINQTLSPVLGVAGAPIDMAVTRSTKQELDGLYATAIGSLELRKNLIDAVRDGLAKKYPGAKIEVGNYEVSKHPNFGAWWVAEAGSRKVSTKDSTLYVEVGYLNFIVTDLQGTRADGALGIKFIDGNTGRVIGKTNAGPGVRDVRLLIVKSSEREVRDRISERGLERFKELHDVLIKSAFKKIE
jgi:hypothetical protein